MLWKKQQFDPQDQYTVGRRATEARILYNNLILNDRRLADAYVVEDISGLEDTDLRDDREDNPNRDGETAYTAFNGGRTVTLRGYIRAGNTAKLRAMENSLISAYSPLVESPMEFLYLDEYVNFTNSADLADWTFDTGSGTTTISGGQLSITSTAEKRLFFNGRTYTDVGVEMVLNLNGATTGTGTVDLILKRISSTNYLCAQFDLTTQRFAIKKRVSGTYTQLSTTSAFPYTPSSILRLRARMVGNNICIEAILNGSNPDYYSYSECDGLVSDALVRSFSTLAGGDATTYGAGVPGNGGFGITTSNTTWTVDSVDVFAMNPGDLRIVGRKFGKVELTTAPSRVTPRTDFLITMRSSTGRLESRHAIPTSASTSTTSLAFSGGAVTFPPSGTGLILGGQAAVISNPGIRRTPFQAWISTQSSQSGIGILEAEGNGIGYSLFSPTDEVVINTADRSITSASTGGSLYQYLDDSYEWIQLEPGTNSIYFSGDAAASIIIWFRPVF